VLDEIAKKAKAKTFKFDDFIDMRALRQLESEGVFQ
jgi:hypothetical protein